MTGYLVWRGMRLETVGIWRGISAAIGLAGTFAYHLSVRRLTLVTTGMWSIVYEFACLSVAFGSLFVSNYDVSVVMLIAGAGTSRVGLWVFDITVTQLMQEFIPSGIRGVVGGTQQSLNSLFQLLSFALGIIFPDPREFHIYASSGYIAVSDEKLLTSCFCTQNTLTCLGQRILAQFTPGGPSHAPLYVWRIPEQIVLSYNDRA